MDGSVLSYILLGTGISLPLLVLFHYLLLRYLKKTDGIWKNTVVGALTLFVLVLPAMFFGLIGTPVSLILIALFYRRYLDLKWSLAILTSFLIVVIVNLVPGFFVLILSGYYVSG